MADEGTIRLNLVVNGEPRPTTAPLHLTVGGLIRQALRAAAPEYNRLGSTWRDWEIRTGDGALLDTEARLDALPTGVPWFMHLKAGVGA
ncbi:MAG TPA: DUF2604 domain-containing protein [Dehalococcoidia bacterium]|nr:DUF2604 domain-containing protein [Dehalococcoidia bacterium]